MTGIAKSFGGVAALDHVDFIVHKGEIHALLGGNGAGKPTILKMLSGVHKPDKGEIRINGVRLEEHTPEAASSGVAMIFQEMSLIPSRDSGYDGDRPGNSDVDQQHRRYSDPGPNLLFLFGSGNLGPVPVLLVWALVLAIIGHIALRKTTFGRKVLATGGSETAATLVI
jgi:hypothetical protein